MATIIPKTIGPGGDYATLALWIADCPADLVAVNQIWQGRLKAGELVFTGSGSALSISSTNITSTSPDCYVELTTDTGASFIDHPDVATNPLRYDATKGAAISHTGTSGWAITIGVPYTRVNKIQVRTTNTSSAAGGAITVTGSAANNVDIDQCITDSSGRVSNAGTFSIRGTGTKMRNSLAIQRSTSTTTMIGTLVSSASLYNVTCLSLGATLAAGIATQAPSGTLKNVYVGGATQPHDGGSSPTITNCYSDNARAGWTVVPFSTATFENITNDFRLKAGSGLIDVGATEALYSAVDIFGLSRPQGAGYDIGCHEYYVASAPAGTIAWTEANDTHEAVVDVEISSVAMSIGWTEGDDTHAVVGAVDTASGQLTTRVIKNNNGLPRVNLADCAINIYNATTGALVLRKTGLTTNAEGRLVVLDAALAKATAYAYEVDLRATNLVDAATARRLPVGTTV